MWKVQLFLYIFLYFVQHFSYSSLNPNLQVRIKLQIWILIFFYITFILSQNAHTIKPQHDAYSILVSFILINHSQLQVCSCYDEHMAHKNKKINYILIVYIFGYYKEIPEVRIISSLLTIIIKLTKVLIKEDPKAALNRELG